MATWKDEGFEERSSDIVGTWDSDAGPIRFVPTHASVSDSKKFDKTKPSTLIFGKLTAEAPLKRRSEDEDEDAETFVGKPGDLVGVWAKPGMRDIATLCGVEVIIMRDAAKDKNTNKGNDMKGFRVLSRETPGVLIPITSDRREHSAGVKTYLDLPSYGTNAPVKGPIPF